MDVIIDGNRTHTFETAPSEVIAALGEVSATLQSEGRAIVGINIDGQNLTADRLAEVLENKTPDQVGTISVSTERVAILVGQALDELEQSLPNLPQACHELAHVFQGADPTQGFQHFQVLAELWSHVKERENTVAHALGLDLDSMKVGDTSVKMLHEHLNRTLDDAVRAMESQDLVLLGDLLEYELAPRAESEAEIVSMLKAQAQERAS
ncbi:MAG: hypothetical protein K1Y02_03295 [Candidatus Hydrogenedentes bacterium]|nr:hypothetical protein [Candidatus Hydrogenedentota bacterium]